MISRQTELFRPLLKQTEGVVGMKATIPEVKKQAYAKPILSKEGQLKDITGQTTGASD